MLFSASIVYHIFDFLYGYLSYSLILSFSHSSALTILQFETLLSGIHFV